MPLFWGLNIKPRRKYVQNRAVTYHISGATIVKGNKSKVFLATGEHEFVIAQLNMKRCRQVQLDINIGLEDKIMFSTIGDAKVSLIGYYLNANETVYPDLFYKIKDHGAKLTGAVILPGAEQPAETAEYCGANGFEEAAEYCGANGFEQAAEDYGDNGTEEAAEDCGDNGSEEAEEDCDDNGSEEAEEEYDDNGSEEDGEDSGDNSFEEVTNEIKYDYQPTIEYLNYLNSVKKNNLKRVYSQMN